MAAKKTKKPTLAEVERLAKWLWETSTKSQRTVERRNRSRPGFWTSRTTWEETCDQSKESVRLTARAVIAHIGNIKE